MIANILVDVLESLYQIFGVSLLIAILAMFGWLYCREHGVRAGLRKLLEGFRMSGQFRMFFFWSLCIALILCKTLFCRKNMDTAL